MHFRPNNSIFHKVDDTILIFTWNAQVQIRIQDCADVEDILNGIFDAFLYPILYQAHVEKLFK
ncbi:MAG: hypothetical protein XE11_2612 [Methanomicrobiales archaeon 53_19]|nr:MAG: hypothetical protein XD88_2087 [Methanocalculus sp. 52_23]KUK99909.1 MAG: hypothetical protein XE11_2612 [Methanomicrobiales archaeon 53_19]